jgi:hypothetical protein
MASTFTKYFKQSVGASNNVIYNPTTAGMQATVIGMTICNKSNSTIQVSATLSIGANAQNAGANSVYIVKDAVVPVGSTLVPIGGDQKVVVNQNDFLEVSSNAAASADVLLSVLEVTP